MSGVSKAARVPLPPTPTCRRHCLMGFAVLATSKVRTLQSSTGSYSLAIVRDRPSFNQLIKLRFRNSEFALQNFQSMRTKARRIAVSNRCSGEADRIADDLDGRGHRTKILL